MANGAGYDAWATKNLSKDTVSVSAALVTGVLTLAGVLVSNSRSRAVMEVKIDNLTRQVERHNCLIERTYALEQDVAVVKAEIENMRKGQ